MNRYCTVLLLVSVAMLVVSSSWVVAEGGYTSAYRWSADSSQLLIESDCLVGPDELPGLYLLDVENAQISGITRLGDNDYRIGPWPDLPLDTVIVSRNGDIYEFSFETGMLHNLTSTVPFIRNYRLLADNTTLFLVNNEDYDFPEHYDGLYALDITGEDIPRYLTPNISNITAYHLFSNDETLLILTEMGESYRVNILTGEATKLAEDIRLGQALVEDVTSGDVIYLYFSDEQRYYSLNVENGELQPADVPPYTRAAPDGTEVYVLHNDLYVLNPATSESRLIWEDFPGSLSEFELFFADNYMVSRSNAGAFALNIASGEIRNLISEFPSETRIWSTYSSERQTIDVLTTDREIYSVSLTGETHHLSADIAPVYGFDVSPNGSYRVFWDDGYNAAVSSAAGEIIGSVSGATYLPTEWLSDNLLILQSMPGSNSASPGWYTAGSLSIYVIPQHMVLRPIPSPDGRLVAFEDCTAEFGVQLVNLDAAPNSQD